MNKNIEKYLRIINAYTVLNLLFNINYQNNEVYFVLNKGGLIENVTLKLEKEKKSK